MQFTFEALTRHTKIVVNKRFIILCLLGAGNELVSFAWCLILIKKYRWILDFDCDNEWLLVIHSITTEKAKSEVNTTISTFNWNLSQTNSIKLKRVRQLSNNFPKLFNFLKALENAETAKDSEISNNSQVCQCAFRYDENASNTSIMFRQ